jgi:hypothetical protein
MDTYSIFLQKNSSIIPYGMFWKTQGQSMYPKNFHSNPKSHN